MTRLPPRLGRVAATTRAGLWFKPLIIGSFGAALGVFLPVLERSVPALAALGGQSELLRALRMDPRSASALVSSAASVLATVVAIIFTLTMVAVQVTASQYTPRLLYRFMSDRTSQWLLGVFIGVIVYLVLLQRTLDAENAQAAVPMLSVALGTLFTLLALAMLVYFLHHATRSVQVGDIVADVGRAAIRAAQALETGRVELAARDAPPSQPAAVLTCSDRGYLQSVSTRALLHAMPRGFLLGRVEARTGDFLLPGMPLLSLWPRRPLPARAQARLRSAFLVGNDRSIEQDVLFGVRQLVDLALKALSPSLNDPTTALMAVNEIGAVAHSVAVTGSLGRDLRVVRGRGRTIWMPSFGLVPLLEEALDELPVVAADHPRILARLMEIRYPFGECRPPELRSRCYSEARCAPDARHRLARTKRQCRS